jgi:hypothetical protein
MLTVATTSSLSGHTTSWPAVPWLLWGLAAITLLAACDLPFGLPSTRALEAGAADGLGNARSFEITGTYAGAGVAWTIDLQVVRPSTEHVALSGGGITLEAIVDGSDAYFRGQEFLSQHLGGDPASRSLVQATGGAWWKGSVSDAPQLPDFTDGAQLQATFLGSAVTQRHDHDSVDGVAAVRFSGPRADVYIGEASPYRLLRVHMKKGAEVDGIAAADLRYTSFDHDFGIVDPTDVINFADLSTLPPNYTVLSVDTTRCGSPCIVSAKVKNLGGGKGARAPSTVTFTMTDSVSQRVLGTCAVQVQPDVGYNATSTVTCVIAGVAGATFNSARVTATPNNPGRA